MNDRADSDTEEVECRALRGEVLAHVRSVSRRIQERIQRAMGETPPGRKLGPDDRTDELPILR